MEITKCSVCDENYNKKNRKKIVCFACEYQQCQECVKRYLLLLPQVEPKCMNCNVEWKINFIKNNLPKSFLDKEYKQHQKQVIFEKEKQHFPTLMNEIYEEKDRKILYEQQEKITKQIREQIKRKNKLRKQVRGLEQKYIVRELECKNCNQEKYTQIDYCGDTYCTRCKKIMTVINQQEKEQEREQDYKIINSLQQQIKEQGEKLVKLIDKQNKIDDKIDRIQIKKKKQVFYIHCPRNDCNGLVNNENDQCGICDIKICKKCNEAEEQGHECKQENIESAKKIRSQCKQCPTCKTQIYRIDGCNDMFCVQCKTSFDWQTGKKMQRTTNPHYYEYIRQNPDMQDTANTEERQDCNPGLIDIRLLTRFLNSEQLIQYTIDPGRKSKSLFIEHSAISKYEYKNITDIHQKVNHIEQHEIRKLEENNNNNRLKIRTLCKEYLNNSLGEEELKDKLQKIIKQQEKKRSIQQILEAYVEVSKREINEVPQQKSVEGVSKKIEIIENFKKYIQEQIEQTKSDYDSKMKIII